ncbi:S41 family peptidase [Pseudonocardia sp. H11422]|uniref:S41 family peptidase n=1 Tax=Pseudonocardia sp. H11422 TaxID=2835866 RepID=UPI001BDD655E|nr:S41 family peptidase [Pseudonocardia sp. H11422]
MSPSYLRFPHLHADSVVFVAEDDVWSAPLSGGRAYRLTADAVPAANPRLSPDGARVAWTSWREGAPEVFVADVEGGGARRLTYWGDPRTRTVGWTADGEVLAVTAAGQASARRTWAHAVPAAGGAPRRLDFGPVSDLALAPDGGPAVLLGTTMSRDMAWWKRYRGGTAGKLWWDPAGSGEFTRLAAELNGQLDSPMLVGDRIAFLSDHEGWGNLYSLPLDGDLTGLRRHTDHGAEGAPAFYARHAATDGSRVIYESAGELWVVDDLGDEAAAQPRGLDVRLGGPRTAREPRRIDTARWLARAVPDRSGRTSIAQVRGTVHRLTHRDGPARTLLAEPGVRARLAQPLGEDRAVWIDDAEGEDAVAIAAIDPHADGAGVTGPVRHGAGEIGRVLELAAAPDGTTVALATHDGRLLVLDTATGALRELARGADGEVSGLSYSPDSAWLAYADPAEAGLSRIMMVRIADDILVEVTEPRFVDTHPVFTADGKYLAFLSLRSFDPIYDQHSFDLTFPASWRPFLVPLAARTPSPFGASPDGRPTSAADEGPEDLPAADDDAAPGEPTDEADAAETAKSVTDKKDRRSDAPPEVVVDIEGLAARVVPVPVSEGRYSGLGAGKDCLLWFRSPVSGILGESRAITGEKWPRPVLERYDLKRRKLDVIADPVSAYEVSGDGIRLVVRDGCTLRVLRTDRSGSGAPGESDADEFEIDTRRITVTVDPTAEWRQMFDETGRLMRDHFWVADMADVDWAAELDRYRPLVDAVGSHDDLVDLLWELHGELGSSHAYVIGGGSNGDASGRPGQLGADLEPDGQGHWRVARVLPPETSAPRARSPLAGPGVDVREGDLILEVAGQPVDPELGPAPLLVGAAEQLVELTVRSGDEVRRVVVRPLSDDLALRYQDWVAGRRAFVAERSGGRLGYLHVPDMVASGWAQLHRDLGRETRREGLIVDVRGNSGGHTSQLVIEKLARKVIGWDVVRHRQPETYPGDAPRGPVVALADEHSGSDGDIVTAAFKRMGIGPVVGVRTWGGVIGIDSRYGLVDGTRVTQPRYSFWFDDLAWDVENHGVEPDIEVVITPQDWVAGRDPQLETAVGLALAALEERPAVRPPDPATRPSRRRPVLPPRP